MKREGGWWLVTHEGTGLVDGYYADNRTALESATFWSEVMGSGCSVALVARLHPIPDSALLNRSGQYDRWLDGAGAAPKVPR
jgi:hypothetical protein